MKTFLYILVVFILCVSAYKLGGVRKQDACLEAISEEREARVLHQIKGLQREMQERNFNPRYKHVCMDDVNNLPNHTHATCIDWCICKGTLCMALKRDYQLDINKDTIRVYNIDTLIGMYITKWNTKLDSIIIKDK